MVMIKLIDSRLSFPFMKMDHRVGDLTGPYLRHRSESV